LKSRAVAEKTGDVNHWKGSSRLSATEKHPRADVASVERTTLHL